MKPPQPTARSPSHMERDRRLIDAAERLFLRKGFHATTMDEIATAAGVSKKTIYQAFDSKEALFHALVQTRRAPIFAAIDTNRPAAEILTEALRTSAQFVLSPKEIGMCRLVAAERNKTPSLAKLFHDESSKPGQFIVEQCIEALAARGDITVENVHDATLMLYGMALGVVQIQLLLGVRSAPSKSEMDRLIRDAVRVFLEGTEKAPHG